MTADEAKVIARNFVNEFFNRKNTAYMDEVFAEDVVEHTAEQPEPVRASAPRSDYSAGPSSATRCNRGKSRMRPYSSNCQISKPRSKGRIKRFNNSSSSKRGSSPANLFSIIIVRSCSRAHCITPMASSGARFTTGVRSCRARCMRAGLPAATAITLTAASCARSPLTPRSRP